MAASMSFAFFSRIDPLLLLISRQKAVFSRSFHGSCVVSGGRFPERSRKHQRSLGYERGPLTEQPDWSYTDGTPAPISGRRRLLRIQQMEYAKKIIQLLGEVDFAVERHRLAEEAKENERQRILDEKLRPKCDDDFVLTRS